MISRTFMASRPGPFGFDHLPHEPFGFLELGPAGPRELTARAIDEEGQHPQARDRPLGTDARQGERPRDGRGVTGEQSRWCLRGDAGDRLDPAPGLPRRVRFRDPPLVARLVPMRSSSGSSGLSVRSSCPDPEPLPDPPDPSIPSGRRLAVQGSVQGSCPQVPETAFGAHDQKWLNEARTKASSAPSRPRNRALPSPSSMAPISVSVMPAAAASAARLPTSLSATLARTS